jgi:ribosome maturation factor RimP
MSYSKIEQAVFNFAEPIAKSLDYVIYDVQYIKEGPHWFLRVSIKRDEGVSIDDCELISRSLSTVLDEKDLIPANYYLEVSSPGIERNLRQDSHFSDATGENIHVKLFSAQDGAKELEGTLTSAADEEITLATKKGEITVPKKNIAKANVIFDF